MKSIGRIFLTGILTILPILATLYLMVWLFAAVEHFLGKLLLLLLPDEYYRAGMGLLAALVLVFLIGLLMRAWLFRQLVKAGESLLLKIPLIKVVYRSLKDLFGLFSDEKNSEALQVVSVQLPGTDIRLLGFLTRSDFSDMPKGVGNEDEVAVYLPMSYQVGGYTVMIPRNRVTPVPMSRKSPMREGGVCSRNPAMTGSSACSGSRNPAAASKLE